MRLPTKPRYGLRTMLDVASNQRPGEPVLMRDIAERQGISEKYLEHVMNGLRNAGLLRSVRGPRGGFFLARQAESITLLDIYEATDGKALSVECLQDGASCGRAPACAARLAWEGLSEAMCDYLRGITLKDLLDKQEELGTEGGLIYHI